jgi:energy-coupling factor transporter ATP-binding protein EcfA2
MFPLTSDEPLLLEEVSVYGGNEGNEDSAIRLRGASLALAKGEWLAIVGVNGSGKSTFARLLAGLSAERMSGYVQRGFAGEEISSIVLQQPRAQLFGETPREEVAFALEWRGIDAERREELTERALGRVGLSLSADQPWHRLSGGQQQLAAIAAATACGMKLLVMDEATSMLDEENRDLVIQVVREIHREGTAVLWVTQRLDELEADDRVVAIDSGRIAYDGGARAFLYGEPGSAGRDAPPESVSPCLRAGLRLPYLMELALELRRLGKLSDPLPMTEREWQRVWGNIGNDETVRGER